MFDQADSIIAQNLTTDYGSSNPTSPLAQEFSLPNGVNLTNLTTGQLTADQVAALQASGAAQVQSVYDNAVTYYGADSPAAQAVAAILSTQEAGVYSDIAALNPAPASSDPLLAATGIAWYWWALGGVAIFALMEMKK